MASNRGVTTIPRNGSGVYSYPPGTRGSPNTTIASAKYNAYIDDAAQDANTPRPVVVGGTGAADPDAAAENLGLVSAKDLAGVNTVGGIAAEITIATDRVYTSLTNSTILAFKPTNASVPGATTISLDGLDPVPLKKIVSSGETEITAGDLVVGGIYTIRYDTTAGLGDGAFVLVNPSSGSAQIGDELDTYRMLDDTWLRRDGAVYSIDDYPDLAELLPPLAGEVDFTALTSGTTTALNDLVFALNKWVVVGNTGLVLSSPDRSAWSTVTSIGTTQTLLSINYLNSKFIATGTAAAVISSDTALSSSWSSATIGASTTAWDSAYGAGLYVVVGGDSGTNVGYIKSSANLSAWTDRSPGSCPCLFSVAFGAGRFVAMGISNKVFTSTDGISWTSSVLDASITQGKVFFVNGIFIVVAGDAIYTSSNGTSWTKIATGIANQFVSVAFGDGHYVSIIGSTDDVAVSGDTLTWTTADSAAGGTLSAIIYDATSERFTAVGSGGKILSIQVLGTEFFRTPNDNPDTGWIKALP